MAAQLDIFYDYTCEDSAALSERLLRLRGEQPDLVLRWRAFPLEWQNGETHGVPTLLAFRAARAAELQGAEAFYRFHPRLFAAYHQEEADISQPAVLRRVAEAARLDVPCWEADAGLAAGGRTAAIEAAIQADFADAQANYVFGTPTVIVDGEGRLFNPSALRAHKRWITDLIG